MSVNLPWLQWSVRYCSLKKIFFFFWFVVLRFACLSSLQILELFWWTQEKIISQGQLGKLANSKIQVFFSAWRQPSPLLKAVPYWIKINTTEYCNRDMNWVLQISGMCPYSNAFPLRPSENTLFTLESGNVSTGKSNRWRDQTTKLYALQNTAFCEASEWTTFRLPWKGGITFL